MNPWEKLIESDLSWREAELASMKMDILRAPPNSDKQRALLRAIFAILYAHYEGFFKFCWQLFLDEVQKSSTERRFCHEGLAILSLKDEFSALKGKLSPEMIWRFCVGEFPVRCSEAIRFSSETTELDSEANLYPSKLKKYLAALGIPDVIVDTHAPVLKSLVGRRNEIAHGKRHHIASLAEYDGYEEAAYQVMCEIGVLIARSLDSKSYVVGPVST